MTDEQHAAVLAMMQAANEHMNQLRAAIDALTKRVADLEAR